MPDLIPILIPTPAGKMRQRSVLITHGRKITHHEAPLATTASAPAMQAFRFPSLEPDRVERDVDPVVLKHGFTKDPPLAFPGLLMRAVQALIRTGQLFGHRSMHVYSEALAESPHTRAVVRGHPHGIAQRRHVNAVKLSHARFLLIGRQSCTMLALLWYEHTRHRQSQ
jgi:hypothetical protein